jgi:hypothetical protein
MFFDRQQYLLAVAAHAKRHEQRDRGCLLVKTHAHDRAIKTASILALTPS